MKQMRPGILKLQDTPMHQGIRPPGETITIEVEMMIETQEEAVIGEHAQETEMSLMTAYQMR